MTQKTAIDWADKIASEINSLEAANTASQRSVRKGYSKLLEQIDGQIVIDVAGELMMRPGLRWIGYELVAFHKAAFNRLDIRQVEKLGQGIGSWHDVDTFARLLSGPAWVAGLVEDDQIKKWAKSSDRWWRRAALVSTIAWNIRSHGGKGDTVRTMAVCEMLADDKDDMVVKAMSWALRQLLVHDEAAVLEFISRHDSTLAARAKREVLNKVRTGLKTPKRD